MGKRGLLAIGQLREFPFVQASTIWAFVRRTPSLLTKNPVPEVGPFSSSSGFDLSGAVEASRLAALVFGGGVGNGVGAGAAHREHEQRWGLPPGSADQ